MSETRICGLSRRDGRMSEFGCGEPKPLTEFGKQGWLCRACLTLYRREQNRRRQAQAWASRLWHKFRLTPEAYDRMREEQDFRCAICRTHEDDVPKTLGRPRLDGKETFSGGAFVVDHCHESNLIRRLLCGPCNTALGMMRDDPALFAAAIDYLAEHAPLRQEAPRARPMPLEHVEVEPVVGMCRAGKHQRDPSARTCKGCVADRRLAVKAAAA